MPNKKMIWFAVALLPHGWAEGVCVRLNGGLIDEVVIGAKPRGMDEVHAYGLPGLSNVHSHAFQFAMAGLAEKAGRDTDDFWTWRDLMYRFVDRIEPHHLEAIASQAYCTMLEAGFTRVGEFHYLHRDRAGLFYADKAAMAGAIGSAAAETGIGLTLLPVLYSYSNFGGQAPNRAQRRFVNDLDDYMSLLNQTRHALRNVEGVEVGIAPHSLRAVALEQLREVVANSGNCPIHIHVAEQLQEVSDCLSWSGRRPVDLLLDNVAVDNRWCLVHATHASETELQRIAASGAVAGLCPVTEANLGDGIFDASRFRELGGKYGVGSDSNISIGVTRELSLLEYSQRLSLKKRNVMATPGSSTGRCLYDAALSGGHQAVRERPGGISVGAPGNLVSLRPVRATLPHTDGDVVLSSWIFGVGNYEVDSVWVGARKCVQDGRHFNRDRIGSAYDLAMRQMLSD